jgi:hypothetical protein
MVHIITNPMTVGVCRKGWRGKWPNLTLKAVHDGEDSPLRLYCVLWARDNRFRALEVGLNCGGAHTLVNWLGENYCPTL